MTYPHVSPNQRPIALLAPPSATPRPWLPVNLMRYSARNRKGYPKPSLAPDSAMMIFCRLGGMFLSANFPLTMLFDKIGSVGVTHDPTAKAKRNGTFGTSAQMMREVTIHMMHMPGPSKMARLRHSFCRYLLGSCTPARTSWTPSTRRVKYSVIVSRSISLPFA
jgi:hypothetical protein